MPEADFVARTYEEIVSDPNHNDYPLAERHAAAGLAPLKRRPERVKRRPRPPRSAPGEHPRGPSRPDASRESFGSPFWLHLGAPGASFSSFLGVLFEPRARSARQTKALVEITGQKVFRDRCGPDVQRPLSTKLLN